MKKLITILAAPVLVALFINSTLAFNDNGACYYKSNQPDVYIQCGDDGCLYPDGTYQNREGYYDKNGQLLPDSNPKEFWGVDMSVCYADDLKTPIPPGGFPDNEGPTEEMHNEDFSNETSGEQHFNEDERRFEHLQKFNLAEEVTNMQQQLSGAQSMFNSLQTHEDQRIQRAAEKLISLADRGLALLNKMQEVIIDGQITDEKLLEESWQMLDKLGQEAEEHMQTLAAYFTNNPEALSKLPENEKELMNKWMQEEMGHQEGPRQNFEEVYEGFDINEEDRMKMEKHIEKDLMDRVMRKIDGELMEKLAPYMDEDNIRNVLNNIDFFDEDLLENSVNVYDEMDEIKNPGEDFRRLREETKGSLIMEEVGEEMKNKWEKVKEAFQNNDQDTLDKLKDEIDQLLEKNRDLSFRGDQAMMFEDLPLDHWSTKFVNELRQDEIVDGYRDQDGKRLGQYGPGNPVTIAELLKMSLARSGQSVEAGEGEHWAEKAGYVQKARELGLDKLVDMGNLNRSATREETAIIVAEIFDYNVDVKWQDPFDDYDGEFKGHVQAVYDEGVFSGHGETGDFKGEDNINRAETAKVIDVAGEELELEREMEDLEERLEEAQ